MCFLKNWLIKYLRESPWDDAFVLVDEVYVAERSTILISKTSGGIVSINAHLKLDNTVNFADQKLNLAFSMSRGTIFDFAGQTDTRPLFHAVKPTIKPKGTVSGQRGPKPGGPSLSSLYEYAKTLIGNREIRPTEIELVAAEESLVEAVLTVGGRSAAFQIAFEDLTPEYVIEDNLETEEEIVPIEKILVFID